MDSNDLRQGHWVGGCAFSMAEAMRWQQLSNAVARLGRERLDVVREELVREQTARDAYWAAHPAGPARLQVLCDELGAREPGWSARAVAGVVFER